MITSNSLTGQRRSVLALAVLAAGLISAAAQAATDDSAPPQVTVRYSDLNLNTDQGTNALYARIVAAARTVCQAPEVDIRDLPAVAREHACEEQAVAHAVSDAHNARLASMYSAHLRHG